MRRGAGELPVLLHPFITHTLPQGRAFNPLNSALFVGLRWGLPARL